MKRINAVMDQLSIEEWAGDHSFIYSSWLRSFVGNSILTRGVPSQWVYKFHAAVISVILVRAKIFVMVLREDPDVIIGYAVAEAIGPRAVIHYVYVKKAYQKMGIASSLIDHIRNLLHYDKSLAVIASHTTDLGRERLMKRHGLLYNPYLIFMEDALDGNAEAHKSGIEGSHSDRI